MGTKNHSVYEPDPVPPYPVQEKRESATKKKKGRFKLPEFGYSSEGREEFKVINTRFVGKIIALLGAVSFFYFTYNEFSTVSQGLIWSGVVFGAAFFILTKPLRRLTLAIATCMEYVLKGIAFILIAAFWIALIRYVVYVVFAW
jgi:hypothetical protein